MSHRDSFSAAAIGVLASLILWTPATAGQAHVVVPSAPSCIECEIEFTKVATLGGKTKEAGLLCSREADVTSDGSNRFYVADSCWPGEVLVFDLMGNFVGRIGQFGEGPSELGHILRIWATETGLLHVFDTGGRETTLSSFGETVHKQVSLHLPHDVVFLSGKRSIRQYLIPTPEEIGMPLHLVDPEGNILSSFGAVNPTYRADRSYDGTRCIAKSSQDLVWSAYIQPYQIEYWSTAGDLQKTLVRQADWSAPRGEDYGPWVIDIREDEDGNLWTNVGVTSDLYDPDAILSADQANEVIDSVIEVIDPWSGRLIASARNDLVFGWWLDDMLYSFHEDEDFDVFIDIWRVRLNVPEP